MTTLTGTACVARLPGVTCAAHAFVHARVEADKRAIRLGLQGSLAVCAVKNEFADGMGNLRSHSADKVHLWRLKS